MTLSFAYIQTLWNVLYESSDRVAERDALCVWLTELVQCSAGRPPCFDVGVVPRMFAEMVSTVTSPSLLDLGASRFASFLPIAMLATSEWRTLEIF